MKKANTLLILLFLGLPMVAIGQDENPRNVILMIGDGMGLAQVTALRARRTDSVFDQFRVAGFVDTCPAEGEWVTDSAAAATAMATGQRVPNGVLSQDQEGKPLKTVVECAEANGKTTGLVTTCSITHATPAAFYSHVKDRDQQAEVAAFLPASGLDVYFGGGWGWFVPRSIPGSNRSDSRDLMGELTAKGYTVVRDLGAFPALDPQADRVIALMDRDALPRAPKRRVSCGEMTDKALALLQRQAKNGFFLMVEGSQIDWACHENDPEAMMAELRDFEGAVQSAYRFAQQHTGTLLIVTADHETGGLVIDKGRDPEAAAHAKFTRHDHSGILVPLWAYGPASGQFGGIQQNSDLGGKLLRLMEAK